MHDYTCQITHAPFRHPITIIDDRGARLNVELKEFFRTVKHKNWQTPHPISSRPIKTANYNQALKNTIDQLTLEDRYPDYNKNLYNVFLDYLNNKPINSYYTYKELCRQGKSFALTLSGGIGGVSALARMAENKIIHNVYYSFGCDMAKKGITLSRPNRFAFFTPDLSCIITGIFMFTFIQLAFSMGEKQGNTLKGSVLRQGLLAALLLSGMIYANHKIFKNFADHAASTGYDDCLFGRGKDVITPEEVDAELAQLDSNFNYRYLTIGVLVLAFYGAGFISGYLNRKFNQTLHDIPDDEQDTHVHRP